MALSVERPDGLTAALRAADPPIIARIDEDRVVLDPRTVLVEQESRLLQTVKQIMESAK